jgi:hypothetical protein
MTEFNPTSSVGTYLHFDVPQRDWDLDGACYTSDPRMFGITLKGSADPIGIAEIFCANCKVVTDCLADDIRRGVTPRTVRGGVIRAERERMAAAYSEGKKYVPSRTQGQYRNVGFTARMGVWREGVISEIQDQEMLVTALEKQITAGVVVADEYFQTQSAQLDAMRDQLTFIDTMEHQW